jgi:transcriptional regulator with XRE-family HTH domain
MMQGSLAEKLRVLRARMGLSLTEAATRAGVTRDTLSDLEHGKRHPYMPTLSKIAAGYGVPVEELLEESVLAGKAEAPPLSGPEKQLPEVAGEERHPNDEVTQRRIYSGLASERAGLLESMAELWDRLLDRGEDNVDTLRLIEHVTIREVINHAIDEEEIKERCAPEQRDQLARAEQRLLEADRRVSQAIEAKLPSLEIDKRRAARAEHQAKFQHLGIAKLA